MTSRILILLMGLALSATGQRGGRGVANPEEGAMTPTAASDIARAKAEHEQNVKDSTRLAELAEKLKNDLAASGSYTLSVGTVKNLDEMEKLLKKVRSRIKSAGTPLNVRPMDDVTTPGPGR